jgi:flagellar hook assembly protein FlgD
MEVFKGSLIISGDFCSLSGREFGNIASYNLPSSTSPESDKLNDKDNKFKLEQNYPNPFNPSTNIRFTIPGSLQNYGNVQVRIYDITGREAAVVVNEALNPGTYEFKWDGTGYSSGIYYYKLICGNYAETKKMLLVK